MQPVAISSGRALGYKRFIKMKGADGTGIRLGVRLRQDGELGVVPAEGGAATVTDPGPIALRDG